MAQIAKAYWQAGTQVIGLPRNFWFEGNAVTIERRGGKIVLSPIPGVSVAPPDGDGFIAPVGFFAGFLGGRPRRRTQAEMAADIRQIFGQAPANTNAPLPKAEAPSD